MPAELFRSEHDSLGSVEIPADALWGPQTQRAVGNFQISGLRMPPEFIRALALIKRAAAHCNADLGLLDRDRAGAIAEAAHQVASGGHDEQFPVDVFQTGSGTSTNMNVNEVIARLAGAHTPLPVHPNDHVNLCQSSNDVIPTAIHLASLDGLRGQLAPACMALVESCLARESDIGEIAKTGRTHLMDAMPLTLGQEISGWRGLVENALQRLDAVQARLLEVPLGGTAVGTGVNAHAQFADHCCALLATETGFRLTPSSNRFAIMSGMDAAVDLSSQLRQLALALHKIANDLRWMNSGPNAGLAEIRLPALQPGSSIMPGKINPVIPEAVMMACTQVVGLDLACAMAGQSGNFQLNTMLPLIAHNLLSCIRLLTGAARSLARDAIAGFAPDAEHIAQPLAANPVLVTALVPLIGYEKAAAIAQRAFAEHRSIAEVAAQMSGIEPKRLARLLDPLRLTRGGLNESDDD
ncbi:MAG: class II fumarate hydratase [Steroidobacteraceae bacterium]